MKEVLNFLKGIFGTFTTTEEGHSARKWSAFFSVIMAGFLSVKHTTDSNVVMVDTMALVTEKISIREQSKL